MKDSTKNTFKTLLKLGPKDFVFLAAILGLIFLLIRGPKPPAPITQIVYIDTCIHVLPPVIDPVPDVVKPITHAKDTITDTLFLNQPIELPGIAPGIELPGLSLTENTYLDTIQTKESILYSKIVTEGTLKGFYPSIRYKIPYEIETIKYIKKDFAIGAGVGIITNFKGEFETFADVNFKFKSAVIMYGYLPYTNKHLFSLGVQYEF